MAEVAPMRVERGIVLEGRHVRLVPLSLDHAEELFVAGHDEDIWQYLPCAMPADLQAMRGWIEEAFQENFGTAVPFAIVHRELGRVVGSTRYHEISPENHVLEIGWSWLARPYWRTGMNTESKYLLLRHAFEQLGAMRVQFKTDLRNVRSQEAIAHLGASREGVFRKHRIVKGGYRRSSVYYSIIDDEWPAVRARLESMLG